MTEGLCQRYPLPSLCFSQVLILKEVKVVCFDILLQVLILKEMQERTGIGERWGEIGSRSRMAMPEPKSREGGMPPRVFLQKSPQAIENKRLERAKERKERKRVRKRLKTKGRLGGQGRQIGFATEAQRHRAREQEYTPVTTGSMRNVLRMGEILALRDADDGRSGWLRKDTRGCGRKEGRNGDTVSRLGLQITASVTICQVRN